MTTSQEPGQAEPWRKSSFSMSGDCVEVLRRPEGDVFVRDSKDPDGPRLHFTATEWCAFLKGVLASEFGDPNAG